MPDPAAKDVSRGLPHQREPSPNDVSGHYGRVDPEQLSEEQLKTWKPGQLDLDDWHPPVAPEHLDPESHVEVVPRDQREPDAIASRPLNPNYQD